jgi:hypothetical protein
MIRRNSLAVLALAKLNALSYDFVPKPQLNFLFCLDLLRKVELDGEPLVRLICYIAF